MQKALALSERVSRETAITKAPASIPSTAVKLARQIFGPLANKKVLVLGAGEMGELSACELIKQSGGTVTISVINRTFERAAELAAKLGGTAFPFEDRWRHMADADIIIGSASCPHRILGRDEAERIMAERKLRAAAACTAAGAEKTHQTARPLLIADLAMPRDIDPAVRNVKGIFLYDLDDLENVSDDTAAERDAAAAAAQKILRAEAQGFRCSLTTDTVVPTIVQVRQRLDEVCRKELNAFREQNGPFSKDQDEMLDAVLARMTQRISASLAREIKEFPEKVEQEQMTQALQRLFHLPTENQRNVSSKSA
jgi:glutamyl-tRNA reductase